MLPGDPLIRHYSLASTTNDSQGIPVYLDSLVNTKSDFQGLPVHLDSGLSMALLPHDVFAAIGSDYPEATLDSARGLYVVPCDIPKGSIDFSFGIKTIRVPYSEFIRHDRNGAGHDDCALRIMEAAKGGDTMLGDTFLTLAYVVFDANNQQVWLNQADDCGSNITAIGAGPQGVLQISGCACSLADKT